DFDPSHKAIGVPAMQGTTSKTTKYNDPMMQLCLAQMIALYKPQGEPFLNSAAVNVLSTMKRRMIEVEKDIEKQPSAVLEQEQKLLLQGIEKISNLLELRKEGQKPSFADAIKGKEPENIFIRQKFAEQVALMKLIYVSPKTANRSVHDTLK